MTRSGSKTTEFTTRGILHILLDKCFHHISPSKKRLNLWGRNHIFTLKHHDVRQFSYCECNAFVQQYLSHPGPASPVLARFLLSRPSRGCSVHQPCHRKRESALVCISLHYSSTCRYLSMSNSMLLALSDIYIILLGARACKNPSLHPLPYLYAKLLVM